MLRRLLSASLQKELVKLAQRRARRFGYSLVGYEYGPTLGWLAALAAVLTAYIRVLGAAMRTHHVRLICAYCV